MLIQLDIKVLCDRYHALTVNVGFSIADVVLDSNAAVDEDSTASSVSSAWT